MAARLEQLEGVERVSISESESQAAEITVFPLGHQAGLVERVLAAINELDAEPASLHVEKGRLDEVFRTLTLEEAQ